MTLQEINSIRKKCNRMPTTEHEMVPSAREVLALCSIAELDLWRMGQPPDWDMWESTPHEFYNNVALGRRSYNICAKCNRSKESPIHDVNPPPIVKGF